MASRVYPIFGIDKIFVALSSVAGRSIANSALSPAWSCYSARSRTSV